MCTYALMLHQCTRCKYVQPATRATILQPCPNEARCVTATPISEVRNDVLCERCAGGLPGQAGRRPGAGTGTPAGAGSGRGRGRGRGTVRGTGLDAAGDHDPVGHSHGAVDPATNWCWAVRRNKPAAARERGRRDAREWWESCEREWDERWGGRAGGW
jgi:hypothetical protein